MAIQLHIPAPCHEKWSEMTSVRPDCRHCAACDRQIVDFRLKSDAEVLAYLQRNDGQICGRFASSQLDRPLVAKKQLKRGGLTAVAASFAAVLAAQQASPTTYTAPNSAYQFPIKGAVGLVGIKKVEMPKDSVRTISGRILDEFGDPFPFARICFADTPFGTTSDLEGNFYLKVPIENLNSNPLEIQIKYTGYPVKTVPLPKRILEEDLAILPKQTQLDEPNVLTTGIIITIDQRSKARKFFDKLFR